MEGEQARTHGPGDSMRIPLHDDARVALARREVAPVLLFETIELAGRLTERDTLPQSRDHLQHAGVAGLQIFERGIERREDEVASALESEAVRHHPDHGVRLAVERHGAADNSGIAMEERVPRIGSQHENTRCASVVLARRKGAAQTRLNAEHMEEVGAGDQLSRRMRLGNAAEDGHGEGVIGDALQGMRAGLPSPDVRQGDRRLGASPVGLIDGHQARGIRIGDRMQQDLVHHREHGGSGADTERQGQDGREGEAGAATQQAPGIA